MFGSRTLDRLNQMLDEAMAGTFQEADYDESKLSRLESKWKHFLAASSMSKENLEREKENVKSLVSDISHQTKTPMTNIKMYAELLDENCRAAEARREAGGISEEGERQAAIESDNEKNRRLLAEIIRQTEKLEFLVQSLTKISRLESNIVTVVPEQTPLQQLISDAIAAVAPKAERKNVEIRNEYDSNGAACFDLKWTKEALENILDNAVKYSPSGSKITLSVTEYEIYQAVSVRDEGIGIPEEEIPKIFGRFYRGGAVQQEEGVGIGLYLSRQILKKENGYIKVKSVPGQGSEFMVYLMK